VYITDEATKYLQDWIYFKHRVTYYSNDDESYHGSAMNDDDDNNQKRLYHIIKQKPDSLVFQVQLNNSHVTPQSLYEKLVKGFQQVLEVAGFSDRKEGMNRRKITFHSFRRFVKTIISDCAGKEYSEWFLGHAKSSYYVSKTQIRSGDLSI
jgi:hypothetical protein